MFLSIFFYIQNNSRFCLSCDSNICGEETLQNLLMKCYTWMLSGTCIVKQKFNASSLKSLTAIRARWTQVNIMITQRKSSLVPVIQNKANITIALFSLIDVYLGPGRQFSVQLVLGNLLLNPQSSGRTKSAISLFSDNLE